MKRLAYIARAPKHRDRIYGTGLWSRGDVRNVEDKLAYRMLAHQDIWREESIARQEEAERLDSIDSLEPSEHSVKTLRELLERSTPSDSQVLRLLEREEATSNRKGAVALFNEYLTNDAEGDSDFPAFAAG